jgi:hypothetical protein
VTARRQEPAPPPSEPNLELEAAAPLLTPNNTLQMEPGLSADVTLAVPDYDPERPPTAEEIARIRRIRRPMGAFSQKLELPTRPGYFRHWFNDLPGRVDQAKASGWEHVRDRDGQPKKMVVGRSGQSGGQLAYAMELPEIFWREDMIAKNSDAKSRMDALKASPFQAKAGTVDKSDAGKFYTPQEAAEHGGPLQISGPGGQ